jgi:hypothetical protein
LEKYGAEYKIGDGKKYWDGNGGKHKLDARKRLYRKDLITNRKKALNRYYYKKHISVPGQLSIGDWG